MRIRGEYGAGGRGRIWNCMEMGAIDAQRRRADRRNWSVSPVKPSESGIWIWTCPKLSPQELAQDRGTVWTGSPQNAVPFADILLEEGLLSARAGIIGLHARPKAG